MSQPFAESAPDQPVARFPPTSGAAIGWAGVVGAVGFAAYAVASLPPVTAATFALTALFVAVLLWVTQLRPRVTAYPRELLMRGSLRDVRIPLAAVDEVKMGQTLNVWSGGRRYVCVGIGRSVGNEARQRTRAHSMGDQMGLNRVTDLGPGQATARGPSMSYQDFVLNRIDDLRAAARTAGPVAGERVRTSYAVPEIVALTVTGVGALVSLVL